MIRSFTLYFLTLGNAFFASWNVLFLAYGIQPIRNVLMLLLCFWFQLLVIRRWGNPEKSKEKPQPPDAPPPPSPPATT